MAVIVIALMLLMSLVGCRHETNNYYYYQEDKPIEIEHKDSLLLVPREGYINKDEILIFPRTQQLDQQFYFVPNNPPLIYDGNFIIIED